MCSYFSKESLIGVSNLYSHICLQSKIDIVQITFWLDMIKSLKRYCGQRG